MTIQQKTSSSIFTKPENACTNSLQSQIAVFFAHWKASSETKVMKSLGPVRSPRKSCQYCNLYNTEMAEYSSIDSIFTCRNAVVCTK